MKLEKIISKMKKNNIITDQKCAFSDLTTIGCGGKIYLTLFPTSVEQLVFIAKFLYKKRVKHCFLGHGSNVLASDDDYCGVVVVTSRVSGITVAGQRVLATCGVSTSRLCAELVAHGLSGGEFFGCLPATVGGAVTCNAGCFGQSARQVVTKVWAVCNGRLRRFSNKNCNFQKRSSVFKNRPNCVVVQVEMYFAQTSPSQVRKSLAAMRAQKSATQPLGKRSAGCVLYNETQPVSKLIDQAGLKGFRMGDAQVSEKHAGFIINLDKATASDIYLLIEHVKNVVREKFGVLAKTELCLINFDCEKQ